MAVLSMQTVSAISAHPEQAPLLVKRQLANDPIWNGLTATSNVVLEANKTYFLPAVSTLTLGTLTVLGT